MKALCWHGTNDIRCDNVADPKIEDGRDVVIKVTSCAICGSDLHLMDGLMPTMKSGDILGHEFMGEVIETGSAHNKFRKGDRIIVPFNINCGECRHRLNCRPGQNAGDTGVARVEKVPTPGCGQAQGKPARSRGAYNAPVVCDDTPLGRAVN